MREQRLVKQAADTKRLNQTGKALRLAAAHRNPLRKAYDRVS